MAITLYNKIISIPLKAEIRKQCPLSRYLIKYIKEKDFYDAF